MNELKSGGQRGQGRAEGYSRLWWLSARQGWTGKTNNELSMLISRGETLAATAALVAYSLLEGQEQCAGKRRVRERGVCWGNGPRTHWQNPFCA